MSIRKLGANRAKPTVFRDTLAFVTGTDVNNAVIGLPQRFQYFAFLFQPSGASPIAPGYVFISFDEMMPSITDGMPIKNAADAFYMRAVGIADPVDLLGVSIRAGCPSGTLHVAASDFPIDAEVFTLASGVLVVSGSVTPTVPTQEALVLASGPAAVAMGAASVSIIAANALRKRVIIENSGTVAVAVNPDASAAVFASDHILAPGANWEESGDRLYRGEFRGITAGAAGEVRVSEYI